MDFDKHTVSAVVIASIAVTTDRYFVVQRIVVCAPTLERQYHKDIQSAPLADRSKKKDGEEQSRPEEGF